MEFARLLTHQKPDNTYIPKVTVSALADTSVTASADGHRSIVTFHPKQDITVLSGSFGFTLVFPSSTTLTRLTFDISVPREHPLRAECDSFLLRGFAVGGFLVDPAASTVQKLFGATSMLNPAPLQLFGATTTLVRIDKDHFQAQFSFQGFSLPAGTLRGLVYFNATYN
jgi:hypothetical protein